MFDICFTKLILVLVISFIVLGPHRLQLLIKYIINLIGAIKAFAFDMQKELLKTSKIEDFNRDLKNFRQKDSYNTSSFNNSMQELYKTTNLIKNSIEKSCNLEENSKTND